MQTTTQKRGLLDAREAAREILGRDDPKWVYKHRKDLPTDLFARVGGRLFVRASRLARWLGTADGE